MQVELYAKKGTYDKNGETKRFTDFYVKCGEQLVPVEVKYFGKDGEKDKCYVPRKAVLEAFAAPLPDKE